MYGRNYFMDRCVPEVKHYFMSLQWIDYFKPKNVLDWGCGTGLYMHFIQLEGIPCAGYDPNPWAAKLAYGTSKGAVIDKEPDGKYDLVLCIDVLEHLTIEEAKAAIRKIKDRSKVALFSICFDNDPNFDKDPTHKIRLNRVQWIDLIKQEGMIVEDVPNDFLFKEQLLIGRVRS